MFGLYLKHKKGIILTIALLSLIIGMLALSCSLNARAVAPSIDFARPTVDGNTDEFLSSVNIVFSQKINELRTKYSLTEATYDQTMVRAAEYIAQSAIQADALDKQGAEERAYDASLDLYHIDSLAVVYAECFHSTDIALTSNYLLKYIENSTKYGKTLFSDKTESFGTAVYRTEYEGRIILVAVFCGSTASNVTAISEILPGKILTPDTTAPVVTQTETVYVQVGGSLSESDILAAIEVSDDRGGFVNVSMNLGTLDTSAEGYKVVEVKASDESGNETLFEVDVVVAAKSEPAFAKVTIVLPRIPEGDYWELKNYLEVFDELGIKSIELERDFLSMADFVIEEEPIESSTPGPSETIVASESPNPTSEASPSMAPSENPTSEANQSASPSEEPTGEASPSELPTESPAPTPEIKQTVGGEIKIKVTATNVFGASVSREITFTLASEENETMAQLPYQTYDNIQTVGGAQPKEHGHVLISAGEEDGETRTYNFTYKNGLTTSVTTKSANLVWNPLEAGDTAILVQNASGETLMSETIRVAEQSEIVYNRPVLSIAEEASITKQKAKGLISGLGAEKTADDVLAMFTVNGGNGTTTVTLRNVQGDEISGNTKVGTGVTIEMVEDGVLYEKYTFVILGDTNGDGKIGIGDFAKMRQELLNGNVMTGAFVNASDLNGDGKIGIGDFAKMRQFLLGNITEF